MARSMTAFARQELVKDWGTVTLELRSVNHRYLDISMRMPEDFRNLEHKIREKISAKLGRGKVDVGLKFSRTDIAAAEMLIDKDLVQQISTASREIDHILYNAGSVSSLDILRWPGVIKTPELDSSELSSALFELLDITLTEMLEGREREGEKLANLIQERCQSISEVIVKVKKRLPEIMKIWREKLLTRIQEASVEVDENRVEQELVMLAQKTDVDEELDRLTTHVAEVERVLKDKKPIGRRLDFLMQELNREANTLGSKSIDTETTKASVDLKVFIEQMREQIQNIE
ncbi:MAG: YicC family protein [Gammaproteobacteria bacterium]|nr:YicC family protein [Gammaproteobacteria bacterium]MCW8987375.1 YicC family protein [Gammaproteobacteria bacterium]MCW9031827.1 YicC family protein [Gammaproteobacteria bacterium]